MTATNEKLLRFVVIWDERCGKKQPLMNRNNGASGGYFVLSRIVGRFALTQSSWPTLTQRCSRKWMSGPAAYALVLLEDRGQLVTEKLYPSGEHLPPGRGESPLPLDCYLSWMSRIVLSRIVPHRP